MVAYLGTPNHSHSSQDSTGILVTNLGTPDAPTPGAVRRYLAEFLADPRVVEVPRLVWWAILHGGILRIRPKRSAAAYKKIWTVEGSPLLVIAKRQAMALQEKLTQRYEGRINVALGMRYGNPSIADALETLRTAGVRRMLVLPLYPQYSATTTGSTFDAVSKVLRTWRWLPELRFVSHYHDHPHYIQALVRSIRSSWQKHGQAERLLFSFHGIPERYFAAGDPYYCECQKTARLVTEELELRADRWAVAFQSKMGREEWLTPYTDQVIKEWASNGTRSIEVLCPGFSADCLETLEEIAMQNRDLFLSAGGSSFRYIPALNDEPHHIDALIDLVLENIDSWGVRETALGVRVQRAVDETRERALALGARN
jgi:ferrochelatase